MKLRPGTCDLLNKNPTSSELARLTGEKPDERLDRQGRHDLYPSQFLNDGLFDEYKDISIEVAPAFDDLITIKPRH
jgi:hypothetical protein